MKQKRLQYKIAVWLTMGLMIVDPLVVPFAYAANPIEVDTNAPHERQATVGQAGNGITLVNVAGPSTGGVSRNDYTNFNVPQNGVILNNSYQMSNTKLGGYVPGNANMMRGSANVIVNEVTSHNPTDMKGFIEVAGRKASVVVANPNGITVDGGGFINTDRAVLTTGKTEYDSKGNLNSYRVEQGRISINGNGLNAKDANALQILTEATNVNAGVWANTIETRTGKNTIDAKTLDTKKIGDSSNVGLDVSAIGGMYANSITMKGTNTGLGVNVKGVVSSTQASSITSEGKIIVDGGVTSNGNTTLTGQSIAIHNNGVVQGDVSTTVNSKEAVNNSGLINSGKTTDIKAKSVDNNEGGRIYGDTVAIDANTVKNHTNSEIEQRYHKAGKDLEKAKNDLDAEWNADITKYKTKTELEAHRQRIKELTKIYDEAQENVTAIKKELDTHKAGVIAGRNHVDINTDTINNTGKGFIYSGGTMDLTAKQGISNTGATIKAVKDIELDTPVVNNENVALGVKRVSDGITKNPDKLKVTDPHHKLEGQVFDKSEFPYADNKSGYGTPHVKPVKTAEDEAYNKEMDKDENRVHKFTIIRTETEHTHKEVTNDDPGVISSGGDVVTTGILHNDNSKVISGGKIQTKGRIENISDSMSDKSFITGTTQESKTIRKLKSHGVGHKRRRVWAQEVYMTPTITETNVKPIGTVQEHAEDTLSKATIAKVNDSLDPYGLGGGKGKESHTIDGLSLPTEALYQIHPDITANALIETDSAFTNRKNFLSSQYMLDALANDPERRLKRLGDGFYEQQLINEQIVSATGKQYLEGYTDNEAEYKALLEAGIAFGKAFKLAPGIALSKKQMEAITTDMVWLETKTVVVDGKVQQVLYPKVYLAKQPAKSVDAMGGIISGKAIVSNTNADILNQGIMTADTIVLGAHDVQNTGRIDGRKVNIKAIQDVTNTGNIHGDKQVNINAGRDINVGAHVDRLEHHDIVSRQGTIGVEKDGDLVLSAKRDVNLKGAIVHTGENSKATIEAGQNINLTTEALSSKKDMTVNSDNYNRTDRRTELGTAILSDNNVTLRAGNDVNIRNGIVNSEHGLTSVEAGNDVTITNGKSYSRDEYGLKYKEKSLLSRTTNIIRTDHEHTGVLSSTIGGDTINVKANRNISVTGSNILGTKDVSVSAGNDVHTDSGEETQRDDVYQYSKKSGLMGAGIGFTIGSKKVTDTTDGRYKTQVASNISSSDGEINVKAGNAIHSTTTNYFSNQPADLSAQNVIVDGKHNTAHVVQSHEEKRSGLTVSVGGQIVNELNNVQQLGKRANSRKNSNLSTLEYLEAANTLKHAYNDGTTYNNAKIEKLVEKEKAILAKADELNTAYQAEHPEEKNAMHPDVRTAINNVNNRAKKDRLLNVQVGIGSSKFKQLSELKQENYIGSSIGSKNKVSITADSDNSDKGNIHITGSIIEAPEVNLNATNKLSLDAGTNSSVQRDTYTSSGWSVGATVSPHGNGVIGLDANVYKGKENALETTKTHTGTIIRGKQVNTVSGNDTEIIGSKVIGESVTTKVGHDLKIESLQDTNDYHKISKNKGISVSYGMSGPARVGFDYSRGTTDSHYASVTNQAGIYAGDGGYNVQVNNATTLTGGIIKGSTDKSKNKLSSKSLKMNDIQNEASYSAKTSGYSLSTTKRSKNNPIGITGSPKMGIPVKGNSKSTTHSAISEGIIEIAEKESLEKINHDTEQALNKLAPIFDKKTVEEKEILLTKISDHGYKLIGDIALHEQNVLIKKIEHAEEIGDKEEVAKLRKKAQMWGEGGMYKVALHGAFGAVISDLSGYNGLKGFKTSAINEASQPILEKVGNPDLQKIISIVIAKSINSENISPALVNSATENNWLTHHDQMSLKNDYKNYKDGVISLDEWVRKLAYYDTLMWYEYNHLNIYNTNNEISMELYDDLSPDIIGSGSFQDVMNNLVYKYVTLNGLEDSFYIYKQEASEKIIRSRESSNKYKLNTPNIWNSGSNSNWGQSLNSTQTTNNNESYIMPYQNGIQNPDKRSNFRLVGDDTSNITGFHAKGDKGHLTFTNGINAGANGEISIFRVHHEVEKNAAKIELNGDIFYLAGDVDGKLGQGNIYVKAGALAALAHGNASYSLDFGNFLIVAEGNVYGGGLGASFEGGIDREKGKGKIKFDIVDGVGAGGSITVQFKN
ncbi:MAG: hemagglutinin repeat-containing protein [Veillonella sp.]|jgi:filamentous hemagglutinin family outer membrane protein|uniref:two-partner secretion domain-containing protein n=1 Tax=Veillonella sp. TaxID=1926307 RepID=UPI002904EBF4|nr:hemagglutinin repeat-containing protein [Veillonella sp.]MDU0852907.1 hemagglutinin repeat-containing protein [Veillonella sp.]MDU0923854.1 hemagglutinin repeat-containing protein [Veillonella sp.]MDU1500259.1 hemagglutinin repeat-containing protein [Veillonella sp.]MDU1656000.1 hemagglutinin repeat-containing protein [Veillonella sp.]